MEVGYYSRKFFNGCFSRRGRLSFLTNLPAFYNFGGGESDNFPGVSRNSQGLLTSHLLGYRRGKRELKRKKRK
jgi:hypothetical protein